MQDFQVGGERRSRSVAFDATNRDGLIVTAGVLANRTQEGSLLDEMYRKLSDEGYEPFATKSRDLDIPKYKIYNILQDHNGRAGICADRNPPNLMQAEAAHSAIVLDELEVATKDSVVIVDGDRDKGKNLHRGVRGIDIVAPPIVNCIRSEMYYPHSLLADLVAGAVADDINENGYEAVLSNLLGSVVHSYVDTTQTPERFAEANYAIDKKAEKVPDITYDHGRGETRQERVSCWYQGVFASTKSEQPMSDSINPAVQILRGMGCNEVADWLAE
ncbi:hypothetical protein EGH25_10750 [Haladaptatus sp. F3-133]|uniref:Uncharacterized protein n=1 Tax=Halorutilus salinus TaxID=2487751 RepID=A0A9Q4C5H8_9EURY|nr:hypothetical protein [Halorutilus salinus]MCX2819828.1 hypothetical protein [Halorutilus salinus]